MRPIALVTGGSSNIGWACVRRLAAGHAVVIADLKPPAEPLPDGASYLPLDITDAAACVHVLAEAAGAAGLAVLVHSAAITAAARPVEQIPPAEWRQLLEVNVTGAFLVAQAAIPHLRRTRGAAVMIASRAGRTGYAALNASPAGTKAHYAASKAALLSLVKSLAIELAPDGVRVNAGCRVDRGQAIRASAGGTGRAHPLGRGARRPSGRRRVLVVPTPPARDRARLDVNGGTWMS
jgi:3-oxoacyl-[acyl-carrier protein] reductase